MLKTKFITKFITKFVILIFLFQQERKNITKNYQISIF